jgi:hypothetical protein
VSRRSRRVQVDLNVRGLTDIPDSDLHAILRGADDIIGKGGRNLLTKILRGSTSKPVLENGLGALPEETTVLIAVYHSEEVLDR